MNRANRSATALLSLTILLAIAAGCVDQKKEVAVYQKELDKLPGSNLPVPNDTQPLTLQEAMRLSLYDNLSLGQKGETYLQDLIAKDRAFSAFLPSLTLTPTLTESQPLSRRIPPGHEFSVPLNASETAFDVPNAIAINQAAAKAEADRQTLISTQQTVLQGVVSSYYAVLIDERRVTVDQNSLAADEEKVRQAKAQYQYGNGTLLNIAQNESTASQTRVQLILDRTSAVTDRAALATLIGSPAADRPLTDEYDPPLGEDRSLQSWIEQATQNRQDLKAAAAIVEDDRLGVQSAIAEYYPSLTVNLNYLISEEALPLQERLTSMVSANIPIFLAGTIEEDVRKAFSQLRSDILAQRELHRTIEQAVRSDYAKLHGSIDQVRELRVELAANRDALKYSEAEYSVGLAINLDVLNALNLLLQNELDLATQEYNEKSDYLTLVSDTGCLTLLDAAPSTRPSTQPYNSVEEITTPDVFGATTQSAYPQSPATMP